ncbi:MAG: CehA/McbA family metallohydrolase [Polyangiaceae bacterium]|nr:CehA/McbA family metallohydrolase [Polyangiaceae bacterium]
MKPAPRRNAGLAPAIALTCAGALAISAAGCPGRDRPPAAPITDVSRDGVRIRVLAQPLTASTPRAQAERGDVLLTAPGVSAVVAGHGSRQAGALVDLVSERFELDVVDDVRTALLLDDRELVLETVSVQIDDSGRVPSILVRQRSEAVTVTTHLSARGDGAGLDLHTEATLRRGSGRLVLGDRVRWFGAAPFVPGQGFVHDGSTVSATWLGRAGRDQAYALASDAPLEVRFSPSLRGPVEQLALGTARRLRAGESTSHRRSILLGRRLSDVAAHAWRRAKVPAGEVVARLKPRPEWAVVEARGRHGEVLGAAEADASGAVRLSLPEGEHSLELRSPGGTDLRPVQVLRGKTSEVSFVVPQPAVLEYRFTDDAGRALPVRIDVRGLPPTKDPVLGPMHLASGAGSSTYGLGGAGRVSLPPGRYRVLATHGPEYTIVEQEVSVSARDGVVMRGALTRVVDTTGWVACDFHLHAEPSGDSNVPLRDRLVALLAEDVRFAVATDHNHITDYGPTLRTLETAALVTAVGVELTTRDFGHFNAFPLPPELPMPQIAGATPATLFAEMRANVPGVLLQVNHPRMGHSIGYFDQVGLDVATGTFKREGGSLDFDTVEVFNGFELNSIGVVERNLRDLLALRRAPGVVRAYIGVGNSDSHRLDVHAAGYPRTYVKTGPAQPSAEEVAHGVLAGRAIVTNGPFVELEIDEARVGDGLKTTAPTVEARVRVHAAPWVDVSQVEVWVGPEVIAVLPVTGRDVLRVDERLQIAVPAGKSDVLAVVRGREPLPVLPYTRALPFAFTNPIRVERSP